VFIEHPASWVVNLVELLRSSDIEVSLISLNSQLSSDYDFMEGNCHYYFLRGSPFRLQALSLFQYDRMRLLKTLEKNPPDLIESFGTESAYSYAGVSSQIPCVIYMQGIISELVKYTRPKDAFFRWLQYFITQYVERYTVKKGRYFIVENQFSEKFVRQQNPGALTFTIPNLIASRFFNVESRLEADNYDLVFIGSATAKKGVFDLLAAFKVVKAEFPNSHLKIIGNIDPKTRDEIVNFQNEAGLIDSIELTGLKDAQYLVKTMENGPILVHPSWMDTSPNSVYEAMVAGLPVVASNVGGIPSMIQDGETGLLVNPHEPELLAQKIIYLFKNPAEKNRLANNAKAYWRKNLAQEKILNSLMGVYQTALKGQIAR
jgi:glycosyltransferase involved in cell wall biosynthesis